MLIISSEIIEDQVQVDGRRAICECHTDHLGVEHHVRYRANADMDVNAIMSGRIADIEAGLIEIENEQIISFLQAGGDWQKVVYNYTVPENFLESFITWFWEHEAAETWNLVGFIDSISDADFLSIGLKTAEIGDIRERATKLANIKTEVDMADSLIAAKVG